MLVTMSVPPWVKIPVMNTRSFVSTPPFLLNSIKVLLPSNKLTLLLTVNVPMPLAPGASAAHGKDPLPGKSRTREADSACILNPNSGVGSDFAPLSTQATHCPTIAMSEVNRDLRQAVANIFCAGAVASATPEAGRRGEIGSEACAFR